MAIYSLNLGFVSRSAGRSAVGFSAYISAGHRQDERTGVTYNYGCKNNVIVSRILVPEGAPEWVKNPVILWNRIEECEDEYASSRFRGDPRDSEKNQKSLEAKEKFLSSAQTAQTIMGAIPLELNHLEAEACVEEFLKERFISRGLVLQYALHWDKGNPHFHGMITRRALVEEQFSQRKDQDIVSKAELIVTRQMWEKVANKHLELGGHEARIDSRSHADRGSLFLATEHEGWYAQRLAERGQYSRIVANNDAIRQKNIEILCDHPETLIHEVALKRMTFTRKHIEEEIIRRVGGDEKLFTLIKAKIEGLDLPSELVLKQANQNEVEGGFAIQVQGVAVKLTDGLLKNKDITHAVGQNLNRDHIYTSSAYKQQEDSLIHLAYTLFQRQSKEVSETLIQKSIEICETELKHELSQEQKEAVAHLCSGSDIRVVNGKAGTGKTTLLKAVAQAYQEAGYDVLGTSFQGKAVEIMEQEIGIPCKTLDSFKFAWDKHQAQKELVESGRLWGRPYIYAFNRMKALETQRFNSKNVIIVDEANMIGGHLWEPFLKEVTLQGVKILIVQDPAQIKSRDPGDYGRLFAERFGFVETTSVMRQRIPWQREASQSLNDHHVLDGLKPYHEKGHLTWCDSSQGVYKAVAQDYIKSLRKNPNQTHIVLAYRNTEVYEINKTIREALKGEGHLQSSFQIHGEEYAIGERIRFTKNDHHGRSVRHVSGSLLDSLKALWRPPQAKGVKNGSFGTIESHDEKTSHLTVRLADQRRVEFNAKDYPHFVHGYALGIHKSEASTFDKSIVVLSPLMDPSTTLVAMTRHRDDVQVYVTREQFIDFKEVVSKLGQVSFKTTTQDYHVAEDQKPYFEKIQQYRDLIIESSVLREEMEGSLKPTQPLYKYHSYKAYQACFEEKKRVAEDILKDWDNHAPYVRLAGIRKDILEVEAGLRPRLLSDLEHRASIQVEGYMDLVNQTRSIWKDISDPKAEPKVPSHPGSLAKSHPRYEEYKSLKTERDSLASVFQENKWLYAPFFKTTKDEFSGEVKDYWGEVVSKEKIVYWVGVKSHEEAHHLSQRESLTYERLPQDQKAYFDVVKDYVQTRNDAAAIYSHLQKEKEAPLRITSPESFLTLERFHELQKKRDEFALKIIDSSMQCQPFFDTFKIKEDKLLDHAVAGELREKVSAYAQEINPETRSQQAQELKRILTHSRDHRFLKESGIDSNRLTFDIAFYEKVKLGEISPTLKPDQIYKPIQSYLQSSQESSRLWKIMSAQPQEKSLENQWKEAFQARNENASLIFNNQAAYGVISSMRPWIQKRIEKETAFHAKESSRQSLQQNQSIQKNKENQFRQPTQPYHSAEDVLAKAKGNTISIVADLLGEPNKHLSNKATLRFGTKGSLLINISGHNEGFWKDFETGEKGNLIQLVQREKNLTFKEALSTLGERLIGRSDLSPQKQNSPDQTNFDQARLDHVRREQTQRDEAKDRAQWLNAVSELHLKSKPIERTLAETYFRKERGIESTPLAPDLRYLPKGTSFIYKGERKILQNPNLAAFGRDADGRLRCVQFTKLTDHGARATSLDGEKFSKLQYGISKGAFVTVQEGKNTNRVFIAEGIETALSIKQANVVGKIVVSMGVYNIGSYKGSQKEIIICADNDTHKHNSQTHKLIESTKNHFKNQGKEARIIQPLKAGEDFNDVLKNQGQKGVQVYVKEYLNPNLPEIKEPPKIQAASLITDTPTAMRKIASYLETKFNEMKQFEGTPRADSAKRELDHYASLYKDQNNPIFQALKTENPEIAKALQDYIQVQTLSKGKGMER